MIKPKYNIGDVVFVGEWASYTYWEKCPDCGGNRTLKVNLFDGTEYIIECQGCASGYDPPRGVVESYRYHATAAELVIQGMEMGCFSDNKGHWEYQVGLGDSCHRKVNEDEIFLDEQAALNFAIAKGRQMAINEDARVFMKEKDTRSWAWHVTYHPRKAGKSSEPNKIWNIILGIAREKAKKVKGNSQVDGKEGE